MPLESVSAAASRSSSWLPPAVYETQMRGEHGGRDSRREWLRAVVVVPGAK